MMCDKCGKNLATTHIKTAINGVIEERNLCSYCAAKEGISSFGKSSLSNMLAVMLGDSLEVGAISRERCKCCGASFSDIAQSGKVGCSECYETFRSELLPSINRLHGKVKHVGTAPESFVNVETTEEKVIKLKEKLKLAVEKEEFEEAAKLRDQIKNLEEREG